MSAHEENSDQVECIIHIRKTCVSAEVTKRFDDVTWSKVKTADEYRRHSFKTSKYFAVKIPETYDNTMGYHTECYKDFTAIPIIPINVTEDEQNVNQRKHVLRSDINQLTTSTSGIFPNVCTFCGFVRKSLGKGKRELLGACETDSAEAAIRDAALILNDDQDDQESIIIVASVYILCLLLL